MNYYRTIHTLYGLQRMAAAEATGVSINLVQMAVGDGNGNPVSPSESQTALVREKFRATINRVYQDASDPLLFIAEMAIPPGVGQFTIREVGVFDSNGALFAVANTPAAYKPVASEGAFGDGLYRMAFKVSNATAVTIIVDPNVVVASRSWVINNITAAALIPGGTTGQVLAKLTNADGSYIWKDPTDANVVVDMIEEPQTLAAGQTVVDLAMTTTYGLSVYIEGVRLLASEWTPHPTIQTRLTLGTAYPADTKAAFVQNEPAGSAPAPLERNKNLSDVPDKAVGRTNLGVYSKEESDRLAPVGQIGFFDLETAPQGWLKANGALVSRTAYANLFAKIGTRHGAGDGFNTFALPDARGEFPRGWDDGRGVDNGRSVGTYQGGMIESHSHTTTIPLVQHTSSAGTFGVTDGPPGSTSIPYTSATTGGTETRPRNIAWLVCIKW